MFGKYHFYAKVVNLLPNNDTHAIIDREFSRVEKLCKEGRNCFILFLTDNSKGDARMKDILFSASQSALVSYISMENPSIMVVPVLVDNNKLSFIDTNGKHSLILSDYDRGCKMLNKLLKYY